MVWAPLKLCIAMPSTQTRQAAPTSPTSTPSRTNPTASLIEKFPKHAQRPHTRHERRSTANTHSRLHWRRLPLRACSCWGICNIFAPDTLRLTTHPHCIHFAATDYVSNSTHTPSCSYAVCECCRQFGRAGRRAASITRVLAPWFSVPLDRASKTKS